MSLPTYRNEEFLDFSQESVRKKLSEAFAKWEASFGTHYPMIIGGKEVNRPETFASVNPNQPSQVLGTFPKGTTADVDDAVRAAREAFEVWKRVPAAERVAINLRIANVMRKYRYELTSLVVLEVGKSWLEADAEVAEGIDHFEYSAREMLRYAEGKELVPFASEINEYRYIPLGICAVISPWNFPIGISTGMISSAIVAGNTVVFKPSSDSPLISHFLMKIFAEAGVPDGVVNLVYGSGAVVGDYLASHPQIHFVGFTGSKEVGIRVAQQAAVIGEGQHWFKRVILELGGKNAIIVDANTDLDEAADGVIGGAFGYQGQKCSACSRAIVVADVYDRFIEILAEKVRAMKVGAPKDGYTFGAVINRSSKEKILSYIEIGKQEGRLIVGGDCPDAEGFFVNPTVFADIAPQARLAQEEIFGPVLSVIKANDFDHALEIANNTIYGLSGGVYSKDPMNLHKAKEEFYVGNLYLNRKNTGAWIGAHPFGGYNMSGTNSKLGGPDYLLNFLQSKLITQKITV